MYDKMFNLIKEFNGEWTHRGRMIDYLTFIYICYLNSPNDTCSISFINKAIDLDDKNLNLRKIKMYYYFKKKNWLELFKYSHELLKELSKMDDFNYLIELIEDLPNNKIRNFANSDKIYENDLICEIIFHLAYSSFHLKEENKKNIPIKLLGYLVPERLNPIKDDLCRNFLKYDLTYDHLTSNMSKCKSNDIDFYYTVDINGESLLDDLELFDLDIMSIVELEMNNLDASFKQNKLGLNVNEANECLKYMKRLIQIRALSKDYLNIDKHNLLDFELGEIFRLKKTDIKKFVFIEEYYRTKICKLIDETRNLNHLFTRDNSFDLPKHVIALINLYNDSYDPLINYLKNLLNDESKLVLNSTTSLRSIKDEDTLKKSKSIKILKTFFYLIDKLFNKGKHEMIANLKLNIDQLMSRLKSENFFENEYSYYTRQVNMYLGISFFKCKKYDKCKTLFSYLLNDFELYENKNLIKFYMILSEANDLKRNLNDANYTLTINKFIEELGEIKRNEEQKKVDKNESLIKEIAYHIADFYHKIGNYFKTTEYIKDYNIYIQIENKLAFTNFDLIKLLLDSFFQMKQFSDVLKHFEHFEKLNFFNENSNNQNLLFYLKGASFYYQSSNLTDRQKSFDELFKLVENKIYLSSFDEASFYNDTFDLCLQNIYFLIIEKHFKMSDINRNELDILLGKYEKLKNSILEYKNYSKKQLDDYLLISLFKLDFHLDFFYYQKEIDMKMKQEFFGNETNEPKEFIVDRQSHVDKCEAYLKDINIDLSKKDEEMVDKTANIRFIKSILNELKEDHIASLNYLDELLKTRNYYEQPKYFFVFNGVDELVFFKSFTLFRQKEYLKCQELLQNIDLAFNQHKKYINDAILFYRAYCSYKLTKIQTNKKTYEFQLKDLNDNESSHFKNEIHFFSGKCLFKTNNYQEAWSRLNSCDQGIFLKRKKIMKYLIFTLYNLAIEKHHKHVNSDKERHFKKVVKLIDTFQNSIDSNDIKSQLSCLILIKYKAHSLYLLEEKASDDFIGNMDELKLENALENLLEKFRISNDDLKKKAKEILNSPFMSYLYGIAIMKKIMVDKDYHVKMLNCKIDDKMNYFERLACADLMFTKYLEYFDIKINNDEDLEYFNENYDATIDNKDTKVDANLVKNHTYELVQVEKINTSRFYLGLISQHRYYKSCDYKTALFNYIDIDKPISFRLISLIDFKEISDTSILKYIFFYQGLMQFEMNQYEKAIKSLSKNCNGYVVAQLYEVCSKFRSKSYESISYIYRELQDMFRQINNLNDLSNFSLNEFILLVECINQCMFELTAQKTILLNKLNNNTKEIIKKIDQFKPEWDSNEKNHSQIIKLKKKIQEKTFYSFFFSDQTEDHLNLI
ncbi:unnamed protein product [Brachionus calyciflorus]|uniref:Uncharacterized protein n=1 Tax=Brachionus calyciflorus TaxID=104777 RepID=A0A813Z0V7_9BILA|nr:unnamed protein product [Brachionus calyciflorus]